MQKKFRIAGVQGFYGDSPLGAMQVVSSRAADYLVQDALAELTLSILQKDRDKEENTGYAKDIEFLSKMVYPAALKQGIKIVTNSGGLNPMSAANKIAANLKKAGVTEAIIAVITGDDVAERLTVLREGGEELLHLDTGLPYSDTAQKLTHANVYVGGQKVKEALDAGAHIVLTGRVADPCLTLGIMAHEFGWQIEDAISQDELDKLAFGITVGHVLECGGQASGGNSYAEWPMDYPIHNLGYPIAEIQDEKTAHFTKAPDTGGKLSRNTIREQLVYEIHDPANYLTPDVTVDLTNIELTEPEKGIVRLTGVKGKPRPEKLKLAMGVREGFLTEQFFFFSRPYAYEKAVRFKETAEKIWDTLPLRISNKTFQYIGINGIHEGDAPLPDKDWLDKMNEAGVRVAIKHEDELTGRMAIGAITCLGLNGPPGVNSIPGWGKMNRELLSLWPTLIDRKWIELQTEYLKL